MSVSEDGSSDISKQTVEFYKPPEFACRPPISMEYRIRPVDASKNQKGWNAAKRKELTFVSFGREPPVDLPASHDSVSRKHAVLQYGNGPEGPGWYLYDLGSSHGTFLNDERIPTKEYVLVDEGVPVRLGFANRFKFCLVSSPVSGDREDDLKTAYSPPTWRLQVPADLDYSLEVVSNGSIEKTIFLRDFLVDENFTTIGSRPETAKITDNHPSVSRLHAVLQFGLLGKQYGWFLYDNSSSHGTKLNRKKLAARFYAKLPIGGSFTLGGSKKLYCLAGPEHEKEEEFGKAEISSHVGNQSKKETESTSKPYDPDPIGWLTSYFETEGVPLEFNFTPSGDQNIVCSIELRQVIDASEDTNTVVRGEGRGRDEAKKNAALLACQIIDEQDNDYGHSEFKTRRQQYEENDYYGSDEDEFLDRTGSIEAKRKMRKARYQHDGKTEILTYEVLVKQLEEATENLENIKRSHTEAVEQSKSLKSLSSKFVLSSLRQKLTAAESEVKKLESMVAATKPTNVDQILEKNLEKTTIMEKDKSGEEKKEENKKLEPRITQNSEDVKNEKINQEIFKVPKLPKRPAESEATVVEVEDSPTFEGKSDPRSDEKDKEKLEPKPEGKSCQIPAGYGLIQRKDLQNIKNNELLAKKRRIQKDEENAFFEDSKDSRDVATEIQPEPEDNAVWVPPQGQTGDGWTKLNEKFGGRY